MLVCQCMPFVKLDCGIINSTLWFDREARDVFLTALLMAEPQDFDQPVPQLHVNSLTETGWQAPAGWYGFVPASGPGIIDRAKISQEDGRKALERLGEPESNSRSSEFDGRRLIRIDGGYLVLNYMKYRERDYTSAARSKRYRLKKSRRVSVASRRDITQAEAEAEAYTEKIKSVSSEALYASEPAAFEFPIVGTKGKTWGLSRQQLVDWSVLYPGVDVWAEARKALAWCQAQPSRRKTARGMSKFLVSWLNRATDSPRTALAPITAANSHGRGAQAVDVFDRASEALERVYERRETRARAEGQCLEAPGDSAAGQTGSGDGSGVPARPAKLPG